ncbi:MAG: DegV family protein [Spirochaetaceae bacterium]
MQIKYIDGERFRRALIAGGKRLAEYAEQLNTMNVFPVADSDTGTNMAGTLASVVDRLVRMKDRSLSATAHAAADAALMGARGNSGAILAQFFYGVADQVGNDIAVTSQRFADAVERAIKYAYDAMTNPQEGTILTVIKSWGETFKEANQRSQDLMHALGESLRSAKHALDQTRTTLPALRKAGVVDAGALGFVHVIEGIYLFMTRGSIRDVERADAAAAVVEEPELTEQDGELTYRYCTECLVEGTDLPVAEFRRKLKGMGDSLIVAGSSSKARVHVHTDAPEEVFSYLGGFGTVMEPKADDMKKQFHTAHTAHGDVALVVDSACDIPEEYMEKPYLMVAPLRVTFGNESYVDKLGLSPQHFYQLLRDHPEQLPKTSQPSGHEFRKQYRALLSHYKRVVAVSLSGALSGTIDAARAGIPEDAGERIDIVDSRAVSVATGLIVRRLCEAIEAGASAAEVATLARSLADRTRLVVAVPTMDFLIKGGRLNAKAGKIIGALGLVALIRLNEKGEAKPFGAALNLKRGVNRIVRKTLAALPPDRPADFAVAHVNSPETAQAIRKRLEERLRLRHEPFVLDAAPVLATHTGFGTVAIAYIEPEA